MPPATVIIQNDFPPISLGWLHLWVCWIKFLLEGPPNLLLNITFKLKVGFYSLHLSSIHVIINEELFSMYVCTVYTFTALTYIYREVFPDTPNMEFFKSTVNAHLLSIMWIYSTLFAANCKLQNRIVYFPYFLCDHYYTLYQKGCFPSIRQPHQAQNSSLKTLTSSLTNWQPPPPKKNNWKLYIPDGMEPFCGEKYIS